METRHLLPAEAYWSPEWFDHEQRALFSHTWHLVAAVEELEAPGSFVTYTAGYDPLVVVRGHDGELRAFHNLCPHRGMPLADGCGLMGSSLTCPYHFWNFSTDGSLRNVPQRAEQFGDIDVREYGLQPASVGTWGGSVFVHPDPDASTLDDWLGELPDHIGSYRPDELTELVHHPFEMAANWKLFVENHVDVYHLWYLHSRTLGDYDHDRFEWHQLGRNWVSYEPVKAAGPAHRPEAVTTSIPGLDERDRIGVGAHAVFPNVLMASEAGYFITYACRPLGPDRSLVDLRIRAPEHADAEGLLAGAKAFIVEDIAACEGVQSTARSSRFAAGPMAHDHERPITYFHQHVLESLGRA
jgi:phenylpropionate dioxygenase-like ring-hydroxylating dioxygenase large terminal subunit